MHEYITILKEFGPVLGIVLFFIWRDWRREDRLVTQISSLEKFQREKLITLIQDTTNVVSTNTRQFDQILEFMESWRENDKT